MPEPYYQDTVLVAPGQRVDVLIEATEARRVGLPLPHPHPRRGPDGMFGMVTALIVDER